MKSLTAVTILGTFAVIALVYSVACDEMGFEENEAGIVEVQEELSTCVCRVDGDIENPGDGKTWETACRTVDECVERLDTDPDVKKGCEVWVRQGTIVDGIPMDSSKLEAVGIAENIRAYGGFKGTESRRRERIMNAFNKMARNSQVPRSKRKSPVFSMPSGLAEPQLVDIPEPEILDDPECASCAGDMYINGELAVNQSSNPDSRALAVQSSGTLGNQEIVAVLASQTSNRPILQFSEGTGGALGDGMSIEYDGHDATGDNNKMHINGLDGTHRMTITSGGKVGIGIDPAADLHLYDDGPTIFQIHSPQGYSPQIYFKEGDDLKWGIYHHYSAEFLAINWYGNSSNDRIFSIKYGSPNELKFEGTIYAEEIVVDDVTADFVFEPEYELRPLKSVEEHISRHGHLPEIPSANEIRKNGIGLGEASRLLLQKVEELTLYAIEQKKEIDSLKQEVRNLKKNHGATSSR